MGTLIVLSVTLVYPAFSRYPPSSLAIQKFMPNFPSASPVFWKNSGSVEFPSVSSSERIWPPKSHSSTQPPGLVFLAGDNW